MISIRLYMVYKNANNMSNFFAICLNTYFIKKNSIRVAYKLKKHLNKVFETKQTQDRIKKLPSGPKQTGKPSK
jgi:hypothetical protein